MATELWFSDPSDPFRDCSVLSLLPRTLGNAHQLGSVETLFESMARKGTTQLLEQAHTISKNYSNLPNLGGRDGKKASSPNGKDHPQGRRPGLGRKRAQFSLKPVAIDVLPSIDHIEDPEEYFLAFEQRENAERELKKLRGEDTTALAQHHQSTTTRKCRPGLLGKTTSYKHLFPANADGAEAFSESQEPSDRRISSPSKTSNVMELNKALHSGASGKLVTSQSKKTDGEPLVAMDKEGSMADKEKNIQNILGKLMTEFNNLDGDEGMVLLKESLQLKQIDVGKIFLPELGSTLRIGGSVFNNKRTGGKSEGSQFPQDKPSLPKSPLAAISTLQRRISLRNPVKDFYSLPPNNDSPCSRDSAISKGQNGESISLTDTSHNDKTHRTSWDGAASMVMEARKRLSFEHEMHSPVPDADRTPGSKVTLEEELRECPSCLLEKNTNHHSRRDETSKEDASGAVDSRLQEEAPYSREPSVSKSQDRDSATLTHIKDNEKSSLIRDTSAALVVIENKSCFELKMHSPVSEVGLTTDNLITSEGELTLTGQTSLWGNYTNQNSGEADNANDVFTGLNGSLQEVRIAQVESLITDPLGTAVEDLTAGSVNYSGTEGFSSSPHSKTGLQSTGLFGLDNNLQTEVNAMGQKPVDDAEPFVESSNIPEATTSMDGQLENTFVLPEEQGHKKASGTPLKKGMTKKVPPLRRSKRKDISRRQSLAGAGLEWKSGVRRSSRIRSRPLQYWLGERFLYGRIHDSLATVIGLKYASPAKEGKDPVLKVKSYVPEEYSDLVAQAGLH